MLFFKIYFPVNVIVLLQCLGILTVNEALFICSSFVCQDMDSVSFSFCLWDNVPILKSV